MRTSGFRPYRDSSNVAPAGATPAADPSTHDKMTDLVTAPLLTDIRRVEQEPDEAPPIGIILCAGKKQEQMELLELGKSGIHVAEYLTVLPPQETPKAMLN